MNLEAISYKAIDIAIEKLQTLYNYNIDTEADRKHKTVLYNFIFNGWWQAYIKDHINDIDDGIPVHGHRLIHFNYEHTLSVLASIIVSEAVTLPGNDQLHYNFKNINATTANRLNEICRNSLYDWDEFIFLESYISMKVYMMLIYNEGYTSYLDGPDGFLTYIMRKSPREYIANVDFNLDDCVTIDDAIYVMALQVKNQLLQEKKLKA